MSDYTPTTDEINSVWRSRYDSQYHWATGEELRGYEDEFDRWLKQVKAEVWEEGYRQGIEDERTAEAVQVNIGLGGHATPKEKLGNRYWARTDSTIVYSPVTTPRHLPLTLIYPQDKETK